MSLGRPIMGNEFTHRFSLYTLTLKSKDATLRCWCQVVYGGMTSPGSTPRCRSRSRCSSTLSRRRLCVRVVLSAQTTSISHSVRFPTHLVRYNPSQRAVNTPISKPAIVRVSTDVLQNATVWCDYKLLTHSNTQPAVRRLRHRCLLLVILAFCQ